MTMNGRIVLETWRSVKMNFKVFHTYYFYFVCCQVSYLVKDSRHAWNLSDANMAESTI